MMRWQPNVCFFHAPCDDGFAAAWIVWRLFGDAVDFRPVNYGLPIPDQGLAGKRVLVADFSFKPDVLDRLGRIAKSIVVLDHHKTAQEDLEHYDDLADWLGDEPDNWPPILVQFDMARCGARLTWDFFKPGEKAPRLLDYIEDRDLWRLQLPDGRAFSLYLRSWPFEFQAWSRVADDLDLHAATIAKQAEAIERYYDRQLGELVPIAVRWQEIAGHKVPALNVPWSMASDAAHLLMESYSDAPFAAAYFDNGSSRTYSLRSTDERMDVSEIARRYGGGGHRNAAGFAIPV